MGNRHPVVIQRLGASRGLESFLAQLVSNAPDVTLSTEDENLQGTILGLGDDEKLEFRPHAAYRGRVVGLLAGTRVRVSYLDHGVSCFFRTRVAAAEASSNWKLHLPLYLECNDQRKSHRYLVEGETGFKLHMRGAWNEPRHVFFLVRDISADGVAFYVPGDSSPIGSGTLLVGRILVPGKVVLHSWLRVTNVREPLKSDEPALAGGRFLDFSASDRGLLALALSIWEQKAVP